MPVTPAAGETVRDLQLLDEEFMRTIRQRDPEHLGEFFYSEDSQMLAAGHPPVLGRTAICDYWRKLFSRGLVDLKIETTQYEAERELACGVGRYAMTMETHPGMIHTEKGKYVVVYRRQPDGRWRALVESFSDNG
jgi:ketosteroid isomerase-like protein